MSDSKSLAFGLVASIRLLALDFRPFGILEPLKP